PLVSDADLRIFKTYRAFDDFENQPLHGTFLIDGDGLVRWQDISYEPFNNPDFLLKEAKRLLQLPVTSADRLASSHGGRPELER
ncbi:peroxiredoxin family protein, partial [Verrucomicrobia bacterium]|nr:peroxiredoxin family protein [Verrucomicrobiota bacterium]